MWYVLCIAFESQHAFIQELSCQVANHLTRLTSMSTQKGNVSRTRPQKHQNKTKFKNDLHDKTPKMKSVNSLEIDNVCLRCKAIIEWKIKYKKFKPLKAPATCVKCHNKNVKHAYHTMCSDCSKNLKVCPKCQQSKELIASTNVKSIEDLLKSPDIQAGIKSLPERKRRTFYRHLNKPSFNLTSEEEILEKLKEMSLGSIGDGFEDDFSDDLDESENSENDE